MATLLLVRHGRTTANSSGVLAGWTPGVRLDERGREQAAALARRIADVPLAAVVSSPLERCRETSAEIAAVREGTKLALDAGVQVDDRVGECRYGDWTGREIKTLVKDPLWPVVQNHPSAVVFPGEGGEALRDTQARAVAAVRDWNARLEAEHGPEAQYLMCSHGDVIKAIVADALGLHLDLFQRIMVDPCSLTVVRYGTMRPFVARLNDTGGGVEGLIPAPKRRRAKASSGGKSGVSRKSAAATDDAVVGGGAGAP
ncbi:histidine phosphatase family protein [Yinghuangia seranimata]|uniref:histidine phosphatase family protein n=1 Tax=Yinghuangia seranimata TaxID=408067 RepID=UPI00248D1175|nr:histidine phosphatase family protein [Yinghuangia seranimata]MDI2130173.1 histidine phosphatase family protein [Yinghuangia seranimata]